MRNCSLTRKRKVWKNSSVSPLKSSRWFLIVSAIPLNKQPLLAQVLRLYMRFYWMLASKTVMRRWAMSLLQTPAHSITSLFLIDSRSYLGSWSIRVCGKVEEPETRLPVADVSGLSSEYGGRTRRLNETTGTCGSLWTWYLSATRQSSALYRATGNTPPHPQTFHTKYTVL